MQAMKKELSLPARRMARFRFGLSCRLPAKHTPVTQEERTMVQKSQFNTFRNRTCGQIQGQIPKPAAPTLLEDLSQDL